MDYTFCPHSQGGAFAPDERLEGWCAPARPGFVSTEAMSLAQWFVLSLVVSLAGMCFWLGCLFTAWSHHKR